MEERIYDILNHMEINLEEYEELELSDYQNKANCKRIISKINGNQEKRNMKTWKLGKKIAVASAVMGLVLISATTVSFASEGKVLNYLYTFLNGSGITEEYDEESGDRSTTISMNATENPPVTLDNETLYYIVDGEKIDITNLISDKVAYIGEYVDEQQITHKFIIGGEAKDESFGYEENLFDSNGEFLGSSGYSGSKVEGFGGEDKPVWLVDGRQKIGRSEY